MVRAWKKVSQPSTPLTPSPARWRALFNQCIAELKIAEPGFRPYSLRRGGATFWFQKHQNLDRILIQGRWHTQKSARIYLNEGLAVLSQMKLPATDARLKPFLTVFRNFLLNPSISTLEPPAKGGRTGGRGKASKNTRSGRGKWSHFYLFFGCLVCVPL